MQPILFIVLGLVLIVGAVLFPLDFRGIRVRKVQHDLRQRRWLAERHLGFHDERPYAWKWFVVAGVAGFMGLFFVATGVAGLH